MQMPRVLAACSLLAGFAVAAALAGCKQSGRGPALEMPLSEHNTQRHRTPRSAHASDSPSSPPSGAIPMSQRARQAAGLDAETASAPNTPRDTGFMRAVHETETASHQRSPGQVLRTAFARLLPGQPGAEAAQAWVHHTQGVPFVIGYDRGVAEARATGKPAMFFVTTSTCTWCERLARDCFNDPDVRPLLDNFVCVLVDARKERAVARRLGATAYPHLVFQSADGMTLAQRRGYLPPADFKTMLQEVLAAPAAQ